MPIADKVLPFWQEFMQRSKGEYAICTVSGQKLTYDNFKAKYLRPLMQQLNMKHTIHETRHTFISQCVTKNINMTVIKKNRRSQVNNEFDRANIHTC